MPRATTLPADQRLLLTLPNAAALLDVSLNTLNAWVEAGELPLSRPPAPGGGVLKRVHRRDLEAFAERYRDRPLLVGRRRSA
jgi:excisionase family DNA binding protein